jgi:hypothetical protein
MEGQEKLSQNKMLPKATLTMVTTLKLVNNINITNMDLQVVIIG